MKITITRDSLASLLAGVNAAVPKRATLPVLQCVKLEAVQGDSPGLRASGNDLDLGMELEVGVESVERAGCCVVNYALLAGIAGKLSGEVAALELVGERKLQVTDGANRERVTLLCFDVAEWPELPARLSSEEPAEFAPGALSSMFAKTLPFVSEDASRYILNGVLLEGMEKGALAVATDGRRLSYVERDGKYPTFSVVVPGKLAGVLSGISEAMEVRFTESMMEVVCGRMRVVGKLIEGNFPNWRQVIPADGAKDVHVTTPRKGLMEALALAQLVPEKGGSVVIAGGKKGELTLMASRPDVGDAELMLEGSCSAKARVGYNPQFLRDVLKVLCDDQVEICMENESSPAKFCESGEGWRLTSVLMPMRICGEEAGA